MLSSGINEFVVLEIMKDDDRKKYYEKHPDELQWISATVGATVSGMTGGNITGGASIAASGTKNNLELDAHSTQTRKDSHEDVVKRLDKEYENQNAEDEVYSEEEINRHENNLREVCSESQAYGLTPAASDLLEFYLDQDISKHGIDNITTLPSGFRMVKFGVNSVLNKQYRDNMDLNVILVRHAVDKVGNSGVTQPTYTDSHNLYFYGLNTALSLGTATAIVTFQDVGNEYHAKIELVDYNDYGRKAAQLGSFYEDAFILQQSGRKKTFGLCTTYDVEIPKALLFPHTHGGKSQ